MDADVSSDFDPDEAARGKVVEYLNKLNDILLKYERDRVADSALLNSQKFGALLS